MQPYPVLLVLLTLLWLVGMLEVLEDEVHWMLVTTLSLTLFATLLSSVVVAIVAMFACDPQGMVGGTSKLTVKGSCAPAMSAPMVQSTLVGEYCEQVALELPMNWNPAGMDS